MGASPLEGVRHRRALSRPARARALGLLGASFVFLTVPPAGVVAQQVADPVLEGRVEKAGVTVPDATVVLHRVTADAAGEIDSVRVDTEGRFRLALPSVPDPGGRGEVYFASVRYAGVVYFSSPIVQAVQLDSLHTLEVFDTVSVSESGRDVSVSIRYVVIQPTEEGWEVTDLFQIDNAGQRTLVSPSEDRPVWAQPLPIGVRDPTLGEGEIAPEGMSIADGTVRVTAALPPGPRQVLVRYLVDELDFSLPAPGTTSHMELLIREPAPILDVQGLLAAESVPMEQGVVYRRYAAVDLLDTSIAVAPGRPPTELPVRGMAVLLTLLLTLAGLWAYLRSDQGTGRAAATTPVERPSHGTPSRGASQRSSLLLSVALVDEALNNPHLDEAEADALRRKRADLIRRLEGSG